MRSTSAAVAFALALSATAIAEQERPRFIYPQELRRGPTNSTQPQQTPSQTHSTTPRADDSFIDDFLGHLVSNHAPDSETPDDSDTPTIVVTPTGSSASLPTDVSDDGSDGQSGSVTNSAIVVKPTGLVFLPGPTTPNGHSTVAAPSASSPGGASSIPPTSDAGSEASNSQTGSATPSFPGSSTAGGGGGGGILGSLGGGLLGPIEPVNSLLGDPLPISPSQSKTNTAAQATKGSPILGGLVPSLGNGGLLSPTGGAGASQSTPTKISAPPASPASPINASPVVEEPSIAPTPTPEKATNPLGLPLVSDPLSSLVGGVLGGGSGSGSSSSSAVIAQPSSGNAITPQDPGAILGATGVAGPTIIPTIIPSVLPSILPSVPSIIPSIPSVVQSVVPSLPSAIPSVVPSLPSAIPSVVPTIPSAIPSVVPTIPSAIPSVVPSIPSVQPSAIPTLAPSVLPAVTPSIFPTLAPSIIPSNGISVINTAVQNSSIGDVPTAIGLPTGVLSGLPTSLPSDLPSDILTDTVPTVSPSLPGVPIGNSTIAPTLSDILTNVPTSSPTVAVPTVSASLPTGLLGNSTSSQVPTSGVSVSEDLPTSTGSLLSETASATAIPTGSATASVPVHNSTSVGSTTAPPTGSSSSSKLSPTHADDATSASATGSSSSINVPASSPTSNSQIVTSIKATATLTNSADWIPTEMIIASTTNQYTAPTQTASLGTSTTALPSNIPKVIAPDDSDIPIPADSVLIHIGFTYALNYEFVSETPMAATQIFKYLPEALAFAHNCSEDAIHISRLVPYDSRPTLGYVTTLAELYYPTAWIAQLQMDISSPNSRLYGNPKDIVRKLTDEINPAISIQGDNLPGVPSDPSSTAPPPSNAGSDAFGGSAASPPQSSKQQAATAGIAIGAVSLGAVYGAAMFIIARRYKRKKQAHRRASSIDNSSVGSSEMRYSENGSPALMGGALLSREVTGYDGVAVAEARNSQGSNASSAPTGRGTNISGPVTAENSLGWN